MGVSRCSGLRALCFASTLQRSVTMFCEHAAWAGVGARAIWFCEHAAILSHFASTLCGRVSSLRNLCLMSTFDKIADHTTAIALGMGRYNSLRDVCLASTLDRIVNLSVALRYFGIRV